MEEQNLEQTESANQIDEFKEELKKKVSKLKGVPRTEEVKAKMRKPKCAEGRINMSKAKSGANNPSYGVKKTDEQKAKTSATMKGTRVGTKNPNSKLSELDILMILKKKELFGFSKTLLALEYNVSEDAISYIFNTNKKQKQQEQENITKTSE